MGAVALSLAAALAAAIGSADGERPEAPSPSERAGLDERQASLPRPVLKGVEDLTQVAQLTGPGSLNRTDLAWEPHGTDLGHMFSMGRRLYMVFGDSYGRECWCRGIATPASTAVTCTPGWWIVTAR